MSELQNHYYQLTNPPPDTATQIELDAAIAALRATQQIDVDALNASIAALKLEQDTDDATLQAAIDALGLEQDADIDTVNAAIAALDAEKDADIARLTQLGTAIETARQADVANLNAAIAALKLEQDTDDATLQAAIDALGLEQDADIDTVNAAIAALDAEKDADIAALTQLVNSLDAEQDAEIAALSQLINSTNTTQDAAIAALQAQVSALGDLSAIETRVTNLEAEKREFYYIPAAVFVSELSQASAELITSPFPAVNQPFIFQNNNLDVFYSSADRQGVYTNNPTDIVFDQATGLFTLSGGVYELEACIRVTSFGSTFDFCGLQWSEYDAENSQLQEYGLGNQTIHLPLNAGYRNDTQPVAKAMTTVRQGFTRVVGIRPVFISGSAQWSEWRSYIMIKKLGDLRGRG